MIRWISIKNKKSTYIFYFCLFLSFLILIHEHKIYSNNSNYPIGQLQLVVSSIPSDGNGTQDDSFIDSFKVILGNILFNFF